MLKLNENELIDWFRITEDLRRHGVSVSQYSRESGIPKSTIMGWRSRIGRPCVEEGLHALFIWCEYTGKPIDQTPVYNPFNEFSRR